MADKQIGIKLDVRQTGLQQVDDGLDSISKHLKGLNESVMKQQQKGWGTEAQTKEMREQLRYMNQLVQLYERMARSQGRSSESFGNFRSEIGTMNRDLSSVPAYRTGNFGGMIHRRFGEEAAQSVDKLTSALGKLGSLYAGFNILSTLHSGIQRGDQLSYGFGDISKRMNPNNRDSLQYGRSMLRSFQGYGYEDPDILQATKDYTNTTGALSQKDLRSQMQAILSTGRRYGMDLGQATQYFSGAYQSGITGGSNAQMNPQEFATLVANATVQAHMQGKEVQMMNQLSQVTQMSIQSMAQAGDTKTMAGVLAIGNQSGNQALINNLPSMLSNINQGISNPSGGYGAQALMMRAIGGGKMNFWEEQFQQSLGAFGVNPNNKRTNLENATDYLMNSFQGDKNRQYIMLGQMFNLKPAEAKQFIDTYTQGGKFKSDALDGLRSNMGQNPTNIPQNNTDKYRNAEKHKDFAADDAGSGTLPLRSLTNDAAGSILDTGLGQGLIYGGSALGIGATAYKGYKFLSPFLKKRLGAGGATPTLPPTASRIPGIPTAGAGGLSKFLGPLGSLAGMLSAVEAGDSLGDYVFGHRKGDPKLGLNPFSHEKWQDDRAPFWRRKASDEQQMTSPAPSTMRENYTSAGQDLAPIVVSTIMALAPYMAQIKGVLGLDQRVVAPSSYSATNPSPNNLLGGLRANNLNPGIVLASTSGKPSTSGKSSPSANKLPSKKGSGESATYQTNGSASDAISYYAKEYDVPEYIAYSIAMAESSLNPDSEYGEANGTKSYGLFQLNSKGQGAGYSPDQLKNPMTNAKIGMKAIADAYHKLKSQGLPDDATMAMKVAENSGHPGYGVHSELDDKIYNKAQGILNGTVKIQAGSLDINVKQPDGTTEKHTVKLQAEFTGLET